MGKNQRGFLRILGLLALIAVAVIVYFVYQAVTTRHNKQDFVKARAAIDTIYADIVTKVGKPDNYKRTNDCSRPSQEFTQGPLSCSVGTDFIYGVDSKDQATTLFKKIQGVINDRPDLLMPTHPLVDAIKDTLVVNTIYHSAQDYYKTVNGMGCSVKYTYNTPSETYLTLNNKNTKPFFITMGCDDWAKAQYYPLKN